MKEAEVLSERIAVVDTTFPRFKSPRKVPVIQGKVRRYEFELPSEPEPAGFIKGQKPSLTPEQKALRQVQQSESLKVLKTQVGAAGLKLSKSMGRANISGNARKALGLSPKTTTSPIRTSILPSVSAYAGKGQYELTDGGLSPGQLNKGITGSVIFNTRPSNREELLPRTNEVTKEVTRVLPREISKEITKEVTKIIPREITKLQPKQMQKPITKNITKQTTKNINKPFLRIKIGNPKKTTKLPIRLLPKSKFGSKSKKKGLEIIGKTQYNPSFAASVIGIKATKKPLKIAGGYSPGFRPIIIRNIKSKSILFRRRKKKK